MSFIYSLILLIILIITLSALRQRLVYELSGTALLLFGSTRPGLMLYSLLVLPGTIIHELSHWITAEVLLVRTGEITIFPGADDDTSQKRLGSVATQRTGPLRGFVIGIAPFVSGLAILLVLGRLLSDGWSTYTGWVLALLIYGIMVVGNSMMISSSDRRTWPFIIILFLLIAILISRYYPSLLTTYNSLFITIISPLNQVLGVTAGLNLVMIGGLYATRRFIENLTKRRIL